jgi:hypothetical protein
MCLFHFRSTHMHRDRGRLVCFIVMADAALGIIFMVKFEKFNRYVNAMKKECMGMFLRV